MRGSSPRVRGTRAPEERISRLVRFIPACAGNACKRGGDNGSSPVHPRVCGERSAMRLRTRLPHGSSPRVRGTLHYQNHCIVNSRFIPACAGNALQGKPLKRHSFYDVKQRYRSSRYVQSPRDDWTRPFSGRARFLCDAFVVTLTRRLSLGRQEGYEPKAVEVHRHPPIGAAGLEFETGIIV